jgi:glycosyltransferase involved in cell wall biosynthesis
MSDTSEKLVTVIIPVYNCENYIAKAIDSILRQTHENLEILVLNDGSTDNTDSVVKTFTDRRIRYYTEKINIGKVAVVNKAIELSSGAYIAMQDADDWSEPERIARQVQALNVSENRVLCFTNYNMLGSRKHGKICRTTDGELKSEFLKGGILNHGMYVPTHCATMMVKKNIVDLVGGYSPFFSRRICEDTHWISRLIRMGEAVTVPEILYHYVYCREGSYTYDSQVKLNPIHLYGVHLAQTIIELENLDPLKKVENIDVFRQQELELKACKDALLSKYREANRLQHSYETSTTYRIGKFFILPFKLIKFLKHKLYVGSKQ